MGIFLCSMAAEGKKVIVLFDVDGTLTMPRLVVEPWMVDILAKLRKKVTIGVVGGSDMVKQREQLGQDCTDHFDYNFAENGLDAFKAGEQFATASFKDFLGEENLKRFINFTLHQIADIDIPIKRGTFIEYRNGMLNISPIGRGCAQQERMDFDVYDKEHKIRETLIAKLKEEFKDCDILNSLRYSIGGQISFDVFPNGWDKTYCLQFLEEFDEVHFFGDKTFEGGNDYEIFCSDRTIGHSVSCPEDTRDILNELFL